MRPLVLAILTLGSTGSAQERTQVYFKEPAGMKVFWLTLKDGKAEFSTVPLETPGRFNFRQGAGYRLKLTHIPRHPAMELYPTLEVHGSTPQTRDFLAHNAVPITLTEDDIRSVVKGDYLVKAVYLPAGDGGEMTMVTGEDAVCEAARRGNVLLVLRIGNIAMAPAP
jgi:hypothetical protein